MARRQRLVPRIHFERAGTRYRVKLTNCDGSKVTVITSPQRARKAFEDFTAQGAEVLGEEPVISNAQHVTHLPDLR